MTQSRDGNNKHVMFLKLRPELKNIYTYFQAQVIQNCTTLSRIDIYNMNESENNRISSKENKNQGSTVWWYL